MSALKADDGALPRQTPTRFAALDGWRGICALLVVCFHAPVAGFIHEGAFFRHAFLFVDFFFVLSGFVITHAFYGRLRAEQSFGRFFGARLFRVYPLHLFMLALFVGFEVFLAVTRGPGEAFQEGSSLPALAHNLLMTHSFGFLSGLSWNYPSWSISAELLAYGLFALVVIRAPRALIPLALATMAVGVVVIARLDGTIDTTFHLGWLRCLVGFSLGTVIRRVLWTDGQEASAGENSAAWTIAELAIVAMVVVFVDRLGGTILSLAAPFVFGFALYVFAHEGGLVSRVLKSAPIAFLGAISYSIYMTHAFVISRAENVATVLGNKIHWPIFSAALDGKRLMGANEAEALLALGLIVGATLLASALTYRFVELPGIALGRTFLTRGDRRPTASRRAAA
ncbi:acyltransferase [Aurantimonas sp. VKM B-3413]|uniref:acyltransferase family protein n=1 Tax=Aurantimonas sp. VKM B-3413 TaxID=2779401 RepID=UPI001E575D60|nr:acyltransferase [Aurantimonas sp. VKM B-3413]MCB8839593.1 acyltransferase [Aurantimonas sp. VKM B-3413]